MRGRYSGRLASPEPYKDSDEFFDVEPADKNFELGGQVAQDYAKGHWPGLEWSECPKCGAPDSVSETNHGLHCWNPDCNWWERDSASDPTAGTDPRSARTVDKNGDVRPVHQSATQAPQKFASVFHRAIEDSIEPSGHPWRLAPTPGKPGHSSDSTPSSWVCYASLAQPRSHPRAGGLSPISMLPWSARQALGSRGHLGHMRSLRHPEIDISEVLALDPSAWRQSSPSPWQTYSSLGPRLARSNEGKPYEPAPQQVSTWDLRASGFDKGWALYSSLAAAGLHSPLIEKADHELPHKIAQNQRNRNERCPGPHLVESKSDHIENRADTRNDDQTQDPDNRGLEPAVSRRGLRPVKDHPVLSHSDGHLGALPTAVATNLIGASRTVPEEAYPDGESLHESRRGATDTVGGTDIPEMSLWGTPAIVASLNNLEHLERPQSCDGYRTAYQNTHDEDRGERPRHLGSEPYSKLDREWLSARTLAEWLESSGISDPMPAQDACGVHGTEPTAGWTDSAAVPHLTGIFVDESASYGGVNPRDHGAHPLDMVGEVKVASLDLILEEAQDLSGFVSYGRLGLGMNAEQALDCGKPLRDFEHRIGKSRDAVTQKLEIASLPRASEFRRGRGRKSHSDTLAHQRGLVKEGMPYDDNVWYHVTDASRLPKIQQQGLIGSEQGTDRTWGEYPVEENAVYLHPNIGAAWVYADAYGNAGNEPHQERRWQNPVILRAQGIERGNLAPDHEQVGDYIDRLRENTKNEYDLAPIEDELLNWVDSWEAQNQPSGLEGGSQRYQSSIDMLRAMPPELREFAASEVSRYGGDPVMHYGPIGPHQLEVGRAVPAGEGFDEDAWDQWSTENPREWTEEEREQGVDHAAYDQWLSGQPYLDDEALNALHGYIDDPEDDSLTHHFEWTPLQQYRTSSTDDPDEPYENAWTDEERQKFQDQMAQHGEMYDDEMAPRVTPKIDMDYQKTVRNLYERLLRNDPRDPINGENRQMWIEHLEFYLFRPNRNHPQLQDLTAETQGLADLKATFRQDFGGPFKYGATNPINYKFIPLTAWELQLFDSLAEPERKTWRDRASNLNRRGQKVNEPNRVSGRELYALMMRHDGNCAYCDKTLNWGGGGTADWSTGEDSRNFPLREGDPASGTFDHNHPLNQGGSGGAENILPACWRCNSDLNQWDRRENPPEPRKYEENPLSLEGSVSLRNSDPLSVGLSDQTGATGAVWSVYGSLVADSPYVLTGLTKRIRGETVRSGVRRTEPAGSRLNVASVRGHRDALENQDNSLQEALPEFDQKTAPHALGSRGDPGLPWRVYSKVDLKLNDVRQASPVFRLAADSQGPEWRPTIDVKITDQGERDHKPSPNTQEDLHFTSVSQRRLGINDGFQAAPGMKLVYKGIPLGTMSDEDVEWSLRNLRQVVEQQAITWTRPTEGWSEYASSAYNWAMNRDSEGWALESEEGEERFDVGVVLEGEAPLGSTMPEEDERAYDAVWFDQGSSVTMLFAYFYWIDRQTGDEEFQKIPMGESHTAMRRKSTNTMYHVCLLSYWERDIFANGLDPAESLSEPKGTYLWNNYDNALWYAKEMAVQWKDDYVVLAVDANDVNITTDPAQWRSLDQGDQHGAVFTTEHIGPERLREVAEVQGPLLYDEDGHDADSNEIRQIIEHPQEKTAGWSSVPELVQKVRSVVDRAYDPDFSKGIAPDSRDLIGYATEVLNIQLSLSDEEELAEQLYEWECNAPSPFTQGLESLITDGLQSGSTVPNAEIAGNMETQAWEDQQAKFILDIIEAQVERRRTNGNS